MSTTRSRIIRGTTGGHDNKLPMPTVPFAPQGVTATAGPESALISWSAPDYDGGSPITGYAVLPYIGINALAQIPTNSTSMSYSAAGLADGVAYTFTVAALNAVGESGWAAISNSVTPTPGPLGTPIDGGDTGLVPAQIIDGGNTVTLAWTWTADGGSA